jgi:hypothetical protein
MEMEIEIEIARGICVTSGRGSSVLITFGPWEGVRTPVEPGEKQLQACRGAEVSGASPRGGCLIANRAERGHHSRMPSGRQAHRGRRHPHGPPMALMDAAVR